MKKVLVLLVALMMMALPAVAAIVGTAHDLSSSNTAGYYGATAPSNTNRICVFCHTPHGANTVDGPLWNKTQAIVAVTGVYGDPAGTMDWGTAPTNAEVAATDALLCLSCHDGSSLAGLTNPPNDVVTLTMVDGTRLTGGAVDGPAIIDADFSNDHPIAFDYVTSQTADSELQTKVLVEGAAGMAASLSYGAGNEMWCSSCHDVHGPGNASFLRVNNDGSALCLVCHIK